MCAIPDFAPYKGADEQVHMGGKVVGPTKSTRQTIPIPVKLSSRCQTMLGPISQTSWELVSKGDVKENKCRRKLWKVMSNIVSPSAPEPWGSEAWPALTSGSPGPAQTTGVYWTSNPDLLPLTHGIQTTLQLAHILCADLCHTARNHKNHITPG